MNLPSKLILGFGFALLSLPVSVAENRQEEGEKLIKQVEKTSDIHAIDARPFRLKASFTLLGNGAAPGEGTYKEVWVSRGRWHRDTTLGDFRRTEVGDEKTRWLLDSKNEIPGRAGQLGSLMHVGVEHLSPTIKVAAIRNQTVSGVQTRCVELKGSGVGNETLCIDVQRGVLLLRKTPTLWMGTKSEYSCQYEEYEPFADRLYPRHIQCVESGHPGIDVRIVELSPETSPDAALFVPPPEAKESTNCQGKVHPPKPVQTPDPEYPGREPEPDTPVVLWLIVGKDGKPHEIKVARSAGKAFDDRAIEAVHRWIFQPATCDGDPAEVQINVEVAFRKH